MPRPCPLVHIIMFSANCVLTFSSSSSKEPLTNATCPDLLWADDFTVPLLVDTVLGAVNSGLAAFIMSLAQAGVKIW